MMIIGNKFLLALTLILLVYPSGNIFSQWYYSLQLEQEYNSNPLGIPDPQEDQISRISMGLQKDWDRVSAQYFGSYLSYLQTSIRNYYWQQLYISGGGENTAWNLSVENRLNQEEYNIYDYISAHSAIIHTTNSYGFLWRFNGFVSLNNFLQIPELNNLRFTASGSLNRSFPTRTSLIAALSFNYKYYLEEDLPVQVPADSSSDNQESSSGVHQGPGPGHGSGGGNKDGYYYTSSSGTPQAAQIFLSLRLAQSLTKSTGLALQYQNRLNLNEYDRSIAGLIPGYTTESQIFDDPMSYESQSYGSELTQMLPYQFSVKIAAYYQQKQYVAQGIYVDPENYSDSILREDTFKTSWFTIAKQFNFNLFTETNLALQFSYQWVDNTSNSYWYNYTSQNISLGLQYDI